MLALLSGSCGYYCQAHVDTIISLTFTVITHSLTRVSDGYFLITAARAAYAPPQAPTAGDYLAK